MERVDNVEAQMCRRFYYVTVMLDQSPLFILSIT